MYDWANSKVFFPGPTWVAPEIRQAMASEVFHHRSEALRELLGEVLAGLRSLLYTSGPVFVLTSPASGAMEGAIRSCVRERVLNLANGAFGERWHEIARSTGKSADLMKVEWGRGVRPEQVASALDAGRYDAVTLVHNETSTGVMNPLEAIAEVVRQRPNTLLLVDAVSSMAGVKIEVERLGLDVCLAGVQKCFALPPGMSVVAMSQRALERARTLEPRGFASDFPRHVEAAERNQTVSTPSTAHLFALRLQLERIGKEGVERRFERHRAMARLTRAWAQEKFELYSEEGFHSETVSCIRVPPALDLDQLLERLAARRLIVANGYGRLKGSTFRIGHMGDLSVADVEELLGAADEILKELG